MSDPIYQQASMALVRAVDGTHISYPFLEDGDTSTKVYNMLCTQLATDYDAAQVELDDTMASAASAGVQTLPFPSDSEAYFVGDTGHTSVGGGMISFTRTFCNLPKSITRPSGSEFYTFPGIKLSFAWGSIETITSVSMTLGTKGVTITTQSAHGYTVDSYVKLTMAYKVGTDDFIHTTNGVFRVLAVPSNTTLRIDIGHYWNEQVALSLENGEVTGYTVVRNPTSINAATEVRYDYFLPGVTPGISSASDINMPPQFQVVSVGTGLPVDTVQNNATFPDRDGYLEMINNNHHLVIESSLSEWAGNILVMKTKTCKAR